jgi:hypothetical protein
MIGTPVKKLITRHHCRGRIAARPVAVFAMQKKIGIGVIFALDSDAFPIGVK